MIGARTATLGLVLSMTTDRPDASDSEMSCSCRRCARAVPKQVLTDMVVRAGKAFAEERRFAGCGQPDQDHAFHGGWTLS